ncbi:MAG TPA: PPOX class F420-dependent oxidoreductase [Thermodesulfobacteriota bacterium]|nr:PPOX class F420-dependent oxidoreductase [Thermodesulfobacteriota bacterium]
MFSDKEIDYLKSQKLARIATVSKSLQPDVAVVSYELEGDKLVIPSLDMEKTLKYKNIKDGNHRVALVVDDMESVDPWKPRGIKVHGSAEVVEREGKFGKGLYIEITPQKVWSWGIQKPLFEEKRKAVFDIKDRSGKSAFRMGK